MNQTTPPIEQAASPLRERLRREIALSTPEVSWSASNLDEGTYDAEADVYVQPGVFITARGDESDDVRAVLRVEFAVDPDGGEVALGLARRIAALLEAHGVVPGGTQ